MQQQTNNFLRADFSFQVEVCDATGDYMKYYCRQHKNISNNKAPYSGALFYKNLLSVELLSFARSFLCCYLNGCSICRF